MGQKIRISDSMKYVCPKAKKCPNHLGPKTCDEAVPHEKSRFCKGAFGDAVFEDCPSCVEVKRKLVPVKDTFKDHLSYNMEDPVFRKHYKTEGKRLKKLIGTAMREKKR